MKIKNIFGVIIALIVLLIIDTFSSSLRAVGVQPLVVDLVMDKGSTREFQLELKPEDIQRTADLNLYYPRQQKSGGLSYEKGNLEEHEILNWLQLPRKVVVPPGEETTVNIEVTAPYDAKGTHTAIIMVEPMVEEEGQGITFRVRYAVRVNIHIDTPGLRRTAHLKEFKLVTNEEGRPLIQTRIINNSSLSYNVGGEVTVRAENRHLIERVKIRSQHASQGGRDETTIYPGSEVIFSGEVTEPLTPGKYDFQAFIQYADGKQLIERKTIEIGDEFVNPDNMDYLEITPTNINDKLRKGGVHTGAIDIRNRTGDPINVKVEPKEIESKYKHSVFKDFELQLRGDQQFTLEGRRSKRPVLIARSPREIKDGGYYGQIQVSAFDPETDEKLQTKTIDMDFIVGEEYQYNGQVLNLTSRQVDNEVLLSATVSNDGNVHFKPRAKIYLSQDDEIKYTKYLEMPEEESRILPTKVGLLRNYFNDIKPGKYKAEVTLINQEEEISKSEFDLEIKETVDGEE